MVEKTDDSKPVTESDAVKAKISRWIDGKIENKEATQPRKNAGGRKFLIYGGECESEG